MAVTVDVAPLIIGVLGILLGPEFVILATKLVPVHDSSVITMKSPSWDGKLPPEVNVMLVMVVANPDKGENEGAKAMVRTFPVTCVQRPEAVG